MIIGKSKDGNTLTFTLEGRLDSLSAPELEAEFEQSLGDADRLVLDFSKLEYVSTSGLRTLLTFYKTMSTRNGIAVLNANEMIREVFEVTGFSEILQG